jgi:hypothetical protein
MPLIPLHYLNEACFLSVNEDDKKYAMCLKMAEKDLKGILGRAFFAEIETQFTANAFTTDNENLYEEAIKDYLAWRTYFHYLKFANVTATPTGIRTFNDDSSSIAEDIAMYSLEKHVKEQFVNYQNEISSYIKSVRVTNKDAYPLFDSCGGTPVNNFSITAINGCSYEQINVNVARSIFNNE